MAKRRPSGDGMVRKREDGRWEGRIVVGHKENGDSIFRYVYADTQKELTAKLRQHIDIYQGVDLTEQSRMTLGEWMDQWLENIAGTIRHTTLTRYQGAARIHINPHLGGKPIAQLTGKDVQKLYDALASHGNQITGKGLASSTIRGIHSMLHEALDAAKQAGLIPWNPTEEIPPPKFTCKAKQILTDEQLDIFMAIIQQDDIWHDFFYTELTTGLRRGEICGLKWTDFNEADSTLKVRRTIHQETGGELTAWDTKTTAGTRTIILPPSTVELLRERQKSALHRPGGGCEAADQKRSGWLRGLDADQRREQRPRAEGLHQGRRHSGSGRDGQIYPDSHPHGCRWQAVHRQPDHYHPAGDRPHRDRQCGQGA